MFDFCYVCTCNIRMYVCIYVCIVIHTYVTTNAYVRIHSLCSCIRTYVRMYACVFVCMDGCTNV